MQTSADVDATRILEKGPEYLRKQMELENETKGRMSAVERLAASKPKYVKSQQVVNATQEPAVSFGSASASSNGSSNRSSRRSGQNICRKNSPRGAGTSGAQRGASPQDNVVRRISSKKRPDSILLYRQKCEHLKGSMSDKNKRNLGRLLNSWGKAIPLPEASGKECESEGSRAKCTTPEGSAKEFCSKAAHSEPEQPVTKPTRSDEFAVPMLDSKGPVPNVVRADLVHKRVAEIQRRSRKGVGRSHSDISSRYSKNFADFDNFFKYCGLEGEVIKTLGKDSFSVHSDHGSDELACKIRSFSISKSDDGFSRNSGDSGGLQEEELHEKVRQGTSVIERNARIIKWLYSCKNALESGKTLRDLE